MNHSRRHFIKTTTAGAAGITIGGMGMTAKSYSRIAGANDRIHVGIIGFSNRARYSLIPAFLSQAQETNMDIVALSDIWNQRREEANAYFNEKGINVKLARNNEELYDWNSTDAVVISTADFQHPLHLAQAIEANQDVYVEKPFAETMPDARKAFKAATDSKKIIQVGSQRRSGNNYHAANNYIKSGEFGKINIVEMTWNVNQPGRWRRPQLVSSIKKSDTDWNRYLMNRPFEPWDPRKYLEYRLFWPYSSGIPGQWMCHQIDTVHWFTDLPHPRSVSANGGIYMWQDGRRNFDTMTAVFDYGPLNNASEGFQVVYSSRQHNSAGGVKEIYYSNGGALNLQTNMVTPTGGLTEKHASAMNMEPFMLEEFELPSSNVVTTSDTGTDNMTTAHMRNWMDCLRSRKEPYAPARAGYNHAIAVIMTTAALRTGQRVTFDEANQKVMAGDTEFIY
jgi:predicted dehydrogenase